MPQPEQQRSPNRYYGYMRAMLLGSIALPAAAGIYAGIQSDAARQSVRQARHEATTITTAGGHVSTAVAGEIAAGRSTEDAAKTIELSTTILMAAEVVGAFALARSRRGQTAG